MVLELKFKDLAQVGIPALRFSSRVLGAVRLLRCNDCAKVLSHALRILSASRVRGHCQFDVGFDHVNERVKLDIPAQR